MDVALGSSVEAWYLITLQASSQASRPISVLARLWEIPCSFCSHTWLKARDARIDEWRLENESRDFRISSRMSTGSCSRDMLRWGFFRIQVKIELYHDCQLAI